MTARTAPEMPAHVTAYIAVLVDIAPPLTAAQRAKLSVLLNRPRQIGEAKGK